MIYVCIIFFQLGAFVIADALTRLEKQGALTRLDVFIGVSTIVGLCSMACFLAAMSVNAV